MALLLNSAATMGIYSDVNLAAFDALFTTQMAISGWFRAATVPAVAAVMTSRQDNDTFVDVCIAYYTPGKNVFTSFITTGAGQSVTSVATVEPGVWGHFVAQYDANKASNRLELYVNGVFDSAGTTLSGNIKASTREILIGFTNDNTGTPVLAPFFPFDGALEDIRYYNRVLSAAEVATIFASKGKDGIVSGLQGRWQLGRFGEGVAFSNGEPDLSNGNRSMNKSIGAPVYTSGIQVGRSARIGSAGGRIGS